VTFNNQDTATHSYAWGKEHEIALHELSFVPPAEEIMVDYETGELVEVTLHDGSALVLKKLDRDYDPTNRAEALRVLEEANRCNCLITGLIYIDTTQPAHTDLYGLVDTPLNRLEARRMRPAPETMKMVNELMF
jgi:2-oxoglutarate ferredoxin oxidoreductase subunit beta